MTVADDRDALGAPLDDVVVLDCTVALAGPYATLLLAGLGARVIKVESPDGTSDPARGNAPFAGRDGVHLGRLHADDMSVAMMERGRGKQAITLDLKHPESAGVVADLVRRCDLVVHNWSPGVAKRLGLDHPTVAAINPRIVTCAISGFGADEQPGEQPGGASEHAGTSGRKAMDTIIQAMSGMMMTSGKPGDPPVRHGVPLADLVTPLFAVIGAIAAVHQARRTGAGQFVDVSMLGAMTSLVACEPFEIYERLGIDHRTGDTVPRLTPFGVFAATDGHVALCGPTDRFAVALFTAIDRPDLAADPVLSTRGGRVARHAEVHGVIGDWMRRNSVDHIVAVLGGAGVPVAPVRSPLDAIRDPEVLARGEVQPLEHPDLGPIAGVAGSGLPIRFSRGAAGHHLPAPHVGEHNDIVYAGLLGYTADRIEHLRRAGAI